ncbi:MAG TPA: phytanoyl-CoA dioxygenase family protein [Candidatus Acidoferrum sp.]|jgi:phytanoyl-CoA hydroxylase|nr:phytanoyl-CoA dioxygenase family protein [Candidatus Acidoferrum sp.]
MFTVDQLTEYKANGYTVVREVLPVDRLQSINAEIAALFEAQLRYLQLPVTPGESREAFRDNAKRLLDADVGRYIATSRMSQELPSVAQVLISEPIVNLGRQFGITFPIASTKPIVHIMADVLKIPGGYHMSPPHQDWRSMQGSLDSIVLWMPTVPVKANSHVLKVVPGSHKLGLLDTVEHIMTPTVADPRITDAGFVPVPAEPGDVIVFSSFMVHRTGDEGDGLVRVALSTRFNNADEPTFVERGFPTTYKYSYRLDLITPDFPRADQIDAIFSGD